ASDALVARCTMVSTPSTAARRPCPVVRFPLTRPAPERLLSTRTECPSRRSASTVGTPSVPVPPVTSSSAMSAILAGEGLSHQRRDTVGVPADGAGADKRREEGYIGRRPGRAG